MLALLGRSMFLFHLIPSFEKPQTQSTVVAMKIACITWYIYVVLSAWYLHRVHTLLTFTSIFSRKLESCHLSCFRGVPQGLGLTVSFPPVRVAYRRTYLLQILSRCLFSGSQIEPAAAVNQKFRCLNWRRVAHSSPYSSHSLYSSSGTLGNVRVIYFFLIRLAIISLLILPFTQISPQHPCLHCE